MPDYKITIFRDGDIGIYVESDWAAIRGWEESADGMMEVFKSQEGALRFVRDGEAEGYTFDGKSCLGVGHSSSRRRILPRGRPN
jgi:hypothetical protein